MKAPILHGANIFAAPVTKDNKVIATPMTKNIYTPLAPINNYQADFDFGII